MAPIPGLGMPLIPGAAKTILLERTVAFRNHPQEPEPEPDLDPGERVKRAVLPSREASIAEYLLAMTPHLEALEAPDVSCVTMQRPLSSAPVPNYGYGWSLGEDAVASAADKNLVVLNAASGNPAYSYKQWYFLLDLDADASSSSSLSAIPGGICFEHTNLYRSAGYGTVIVTRQGGDFVLADLLFKLRSREALLCLWESESSSCSWVYKRGQLPTEVPVPRNWRIHAAFPVQSRNRNFFCWVDLLHGLLLWDLSEIHDSFNLLNLSFVPLPHGCCISDGHPRWSSSVPEFRNVSCVDGTIKFLNIDGFVEGTPISLDTYALDLDNPSHPSWMPDTKMLLKDLWADKTFINEQAPRIMFPILSTVQHDVVYPAVPGDVEHVEHYYQFRGVKLALSVDTRKTRVISATKPKDQTPLLRWRYLFAASVSHSQWGSKYHQGAEKAIGMGASGKRMKLE